MTASCNLSKIAGRRHTGVTLVSCLRRSQILEGQRRVRVSSQSGLLPAGTAETGHNAPRSRATRIFELLLYLSNMVLIGERINDHGSSVYRDLSARLPTRATRPRPVGTLGHGLSVRSADLDNLCIAALKAVIRFCRRPRGLPCRRSDVHSGRHQLADDPGAAFARSGLLAIVAPGEGI
jgi:hypothetical protein